MHVLSLIFDAREEFKKKKRKDVKTFCCSSQLAFLFTSQNSFVSSLALVGHPLPLFTDYL